MAACSVPIVYAPNGNPSKLYADLVGITKDTDAALHLWAMSVQWLLTRPWVVI